MDCDMPAGSIMINGASAGSGYNPRFTHANTDHVPDSSYSE